MFQIDTKLVDGDVAAKIVLMNATERSQERTQASPQAFEGVGMDFPDAIAVIIASPFLTTVTHGSVRTKNRRIAIRLVGVEDSTGSGAAMNLSTQRCGFGIGFDPYPNL